MFEMLHTKLTLNEIIRYYKNSIASRHVSPGPCNSTHAWEFVMLFDITNAFLITSGHHEMHFRNSYSKYWELRTFLYPAAKIFALHVPYLKATRLIMREARVRCSHLTTWPWTSDECLPPHKSRTLP